MSTSSHRQLPSYKINGLAFRVRIEVVNGKPVQHVMQGKVPDALEQ